MIKITYLLNFRILSIFEGHFRPSSRFVGQILYLWPCWGKKHEIKKNSLFCPKNAFPIVKNEKTIFKEVDAFVKMESYNFLWKQFE